MKKIITLLFAFFSIQSFSQKLTFDAKAIIAISDADMAASSFIDGKLLKERGSRDLLSVIKLPLEKFSDEIKSVGVSNSVIDWTKGLCISANGKIAYIAESRGAIGDNVNELQNPAVNLPAGGYISVVDISDLTQPKILYKFPTGKNPMGMELSPAGDYLAFCTEESGKEVQVLELDGTGKPVRVIPKPDALPSGKITDLSWHPEGNFIAFTIEDRHQIGLIKVQRDGPTTKIFRLDMTGMPMNVGSYPTIGKFTPDGRYYLILDIKQPENTGSSNGELFVLKFNFSGSGEHALLARATVGANPRSFDIHPQGNIAVVSNAKNSMNVDIKSSLSLIKIPMDGVVQNVGEYEFEGIMPEGLTFDRNGENLAVSVYDYPNYGKHFGGIEFWKVNQAEKPSLQKQSIKVIMPRGTHGIRIVK